MKLEITQDLSVLLSLSIHWSVNLSYSINEESCLSFCLSLHPPTLISICLSFYQSTCLSMLLPISLHVDLLIYLHRCLSTRLSIYLTSSLAALIKTAVYPSTPLSPCRYINLSSCSAVFPHLCPYTPVSFCSIPLSVYLQHFSLSTLLSIYLSTYISLFVYLSTCLLVYPSIHPSNCQEALIKRCLSIHLFMSHNSCTCLFCIIIYLSILPSALIPVCLPFYLSIYQSVYPLHDLSTDFLIYPAVCPTALIKKLSVCILLSVCPINLFFSTLLTIYLSHQFLYFSIHRSIYSFIWLFSWFCFPTPLSLYLYLSTLL